MCLLNSKVATREEEEEDGMSGLGFTNPVGGRLDFFSK